MTLQPLAPRAWLAPRVSNCPPYVTSAGQEAIELAASAGLHLDPWQADVLTHSLGERPNGKWAAFECAVIVPRQNGKGAILEARALAGLFLFGDELILWSAHEFKTAGEAFRRVLRLVEDTPDLDRRVAKVSKSHGEEGIELRDGRRLRFVARSKGSGRGFSGDLIIMDEAYELPSEVMEALLPTMSARRNPQLWYTSTPPLDATSPASATLMSLHDRGRAGSPGLAYFDWGAAEGVDLDDRAEWRRSNPAWEVGRITEEFCERERAAMTDPGFARERLGVWPRSGSSSVIDAQAWAGLAEASTPGALVTLAVDVTPSRDSAVIAAVSTRSDGLLHVEIVDQRPGTSWVVDALLRLRKVINPLAIALDLGAPAGALLLALEEAGIKRSENPDEPKRGELAIPTPREVAQAAGLLVDAVRDATIRHIDQPPLNAAVVGAKTRPLGDAWSWARKSAAVDISPLCAVSLAHWAHHARAGAAADYDPLSYLW